MSCNKRVGIYLRVSTQDQSTEIQATEISQFLKAREWTDFKIYEDKATGTNGNRTNLKVLMQDAKQRKLDIIIVWKLDRLFRSLKDLIITLQHFDELGIEFISLRENIDMSTSIGKMLVGILGSFAQFEADLIKERVRAGLANAKAKGTKLGRPSIIEVTKVMEMRMQGLSLGSIAKQLGVSKTAVHNTLSKYQFINSLTNLEIIQTKKS